MPKKRKIFHKCQLKDWMSNWSTRPTHSHGTSNFSKQNKFQAKTMFTTGETVGMAEWIIDDTCLVSTLILYLFSNYTICETDAIIIGHVCHLWSPRPDPQSLQYSHLNFVSFFEFLKSGDGRTGLHVKIVITTGRVWPRGSICRHARHLFICDKNRIKIASPVGPTDKI